ncbi:hypothetical protein FACS189494_08690 [Spirochaetia bacterium]|nr:hypothetical protein FACS189494_08690 [Spirochaetia bacterium]
MTALFNTFYNSPRYTRRIVVGVFVVAFHVLLLSVRPALSGKTVAGLPKKEHVFKLADINEAPPPPPAEEPPPDLPRQTTTENIAQTIIEVDEAPQDIVIAAAPSQKPAEEEYLPTNKVSQKPVFSRGSITPEYPTFALRAGIEGVVYLELFIDKNGVVQKVVILKEDPAGRGFGESAVAAFTGQKCKPAEVNGQPVAVRYRYPVRFRIS